jgi:hypothetical protein
MATRVMLSTQDGLAEAVTSLSIRATADYASLIRPTGYGLCAAGSRASLYFYSADNSGIIY